MRRRLTGANSISSGTRGATTSPKTGTRPVRNCSRSPYRVAPMGRLRRALASDHVAGWAFIGPAVLLIGVFGILPIVWGLVLSFQKSDLIDPNTPFVGLTNYRALAHDHV